MRAEDNQHPMKPTPDGAAREPFSRRLGIHPSKFFEWEKRYGWANERNALVPRDHWLEPEEVQKRPRRIQPLCRALGDSGGSLSKDACSSFTDGRRPPSPVPSIAHCSRRLPSSAIGKLKGAGTAF